MTETIINGALNPALLKLTPESDKAKYSTRVITIGDITYVGKTIVSLASLTDQPIWQLMRVYAPSGQDLIISYAEGNTNFDNIWDNKENLEYF